MSLLDDLGNLAKQFSSGNASTEDVHAAYDEAAPSIPQGTLAEGISHTFKSDQTPPFEQLVTGLFNQSTPEQKASLLNQLLGSLGPGALQTIGAAAGSGGLAGLLSQGTVTPSQAQEVPPQTVQILAEQAARKDPSIMDKAAGFYAQHPTLVKAIGAGALAFLMSRISASRR